MELCRNSLFICFKTIKWRLFSSKHSLERALNSLQSNWLFQPKFSISRDSALANILRICSDITHNSQYFRNVDFSCPSTQTLRHNWEKKFESRSFVKMFYIILLSQYFGVNLCRDNQANKTIHLESKSGTT